MYSLVENTFMSKELYHTILHPICEKYNMTQTEMVILLFLANNPQKDTATDIVQKRRLTKSSVSMYVRALQEKGLIAGEYINGNHRSIHLKVCEAAKDIVADGRKAQEKFFDIMTLGFSEIEKETLRDYFERVMANIRDYNKNAQLLPK